MDPFTQRLLDRARQRREDLQKKMAEASIPRKRPMPLGDSQVENIPPPEVDDVDDTDGPQAETSHHADSPNKRQCVREAELKQHQDTPAIVSIKARRDVLTHQQTYNGDEMETDSEPLKRSLDIELERETRPTPAARRTRLAALAQTINSWEDDLSHHIVKQDEKPARKVWQPPKPIETSSTNATAISGNIKSSAITISATEEPAPTKPPRTFQHAISPSPTKKWSPVKFVAPQAGSQVKNTATDSELKPEVESRRQVSQITVTLGGADTNQPTAPARTENPKKSTVRSPVKEIPAWRKNSAEEDGPSNQPLSARKATWEKKTTDSTQKPNLLRNPGGTTRTPGRPVTVHFPMKQNTPERSEDELTQKPVSTRKAVWEQKVAQANQERSELSRAAQQLRRSPGKSPRPLRAKSASSLKEGIAEAAAEMQERRSPTKAATSPIKSPSKVAPAARTIHDRLQNLQQNWQKNEIAEQIRQQRVQEMAMLQNRWKNGVLREDSDIEQDHPQTDVQVQPVSVPAGTIPPPPPVPSGPVAPPRSKSGSDIGKSTTEAPKSKPKTLKEIKREEARKKIRNEFLSIGDIMMGGGENNTQQNNFESKLSAMGFDIQPTSSVGGHVATMDLTPIRERQQKSRVRSRTEPEQDVSELMNKAKRRSIAKNPNILMTSEKKVTTTFDDEKAQINKKPIYEVEPEETVKTTFKTTLTINNAATTRSNAPSIYNLIKKTPSGRTTAPPATYSGHSKQQDSFNSSEGSFEEDSEEEMDQQTSPMYRMHHSGRQYSQQSLNSQSSEYSEEPQTDYTEDATETEDYETESQTESQTDDYLTEQTENSEEDYESEEEEEEEEEEGGVDDLLDEAMDDTTVTETESEMEPPQPAPRRHNYSDGRPLAAQRPKSEYDMRTGYSNNHRQVDTRQHRVTFAANVGGLSDSSIGQTMSTGSSRSGSSSSSNESETDTDKPTVYSVDLYRSNKKSQQNVPKMTIVRHSEHVRTEPREEPLPYIPAKSVKQKLQELQELVNQEQSVIMQTSNALNQCCGQNSAFAGSAEAVECHKLLLIACKKREGYILEQQKLRDGRGNQNDGQPMGSLTISDIRLPLKRDFMNRIGTPHDNTVHYFICLLRNKAHTIITQMVSTHDAMVRGSLDFPNLIKLSDIKQDFKYDLEIYGMSVTREQNLGQTPKKKKGLTPKKKGLFGLKSSSTASSMQSPGGPNAVRMTNFVHITTLPINMRMLNKTHFTLDRVPYSSPLQGTIHLKLHCRMESNVEERGFLTMFEDVSGFGSWHRRWVVLKNNKICYWKYPDDAKYKEPMGYIDMKMCITEKVGLIPRDICARPNTFEVVCVRRQQRGEADTLTTKCYNTMTTIRHQLSADTKEDRIVWCDRLNEALKNLRTWHPDAMRPVKAAPADPYDSTV